MADGTVYTSWSTATPDVLVARMGMSPTVRLVLTIGDALTAMVMSMYPALVGLLIVLRTLGVGDFLIEDGATNSPLARGERKTLEDLNASRTDGRWESQGVRALDGVPMTYVIEAPRNALYAPSVDPAACTYGSVSNQTLRTMLCHARIAGAHVIMFDTLEEMARWLVETHLHDYSTAYASAWKPKKYKDGIDAALAALTTKRQDNQTPFLHYVSTLAQIPNVGKVRARLIADTYKTLPRLVDAFKARGENMLSDIDGVGKVISQRIYEYILQVPCKKPVGKKQPPASKRAKLDDQPIVSSAAAAAASASVAEMPIDPSAVDASPIATGAVASAPAPSPKKPPTSFGAYKRKFAPKKPVTLASNSVMLSSSIFAPRKPPAPL
jgi:ERCC4-type nuclease